MRRSNYTPKQRRNYQHRTHNQTRHDISDRSQTSGTLHHGTQSCIHQNNIGGDGAKTAANPITNIQCNGIFSMQQKDTSRKEKEMDMQFHCLRDRECQKQFRIYWRPGKANYADYWTKHHPATHHKKKENNS